MANETLGDIPQTVIKKQRAAREKEREKHLHIQMACNHFLDMLNAQGVIENRNVFVTLDTLAEQRGYSTVNMISNMRFIKKE